jgi:hypothetical protein
LFGGLFGGDSTTSAAGSEGEETSVVTTVLDLPLVDVKPGPLRFYLQMFLVGAQNTPVPNSWTLGTNDESTRLDYYYADGTGMVSMDCAAASGNGTGSSPSSFLVRRHGRRPSLQYRLQESVLLHSLLDELSAIAQMDDVDPENRLIRFVDGTVLDEARRTLPARKEQRGKDEHQ